MIAYKMYLNEVKCVFFPTVTTTIMRKMKWLHANNHNAHGSNKVNNIKNRGEKHSRFDNLQE